MIVQCDGCGKKYKVEPEKIRGREARFKCRSCDQLVTVVKPESNPVEAAHIDFSMGSTSEMDLTDAPGSGDGGAVDGDAGGGEHPEGAADAGAEEVGEDGYASAAASRRRGGMGLTAKLILLMLLVSLVPLGLYSFFSIRQTREEILRNQESMGEQVTLGLSAQVDEWIDKNLRILKALAQMPAIQSMNRTSQESLLKIVQEQYPWMYLVFTTDNWGMNVARSDDKELTDYSDRQYVKDIIAGNEVAWQTLIGKTSKKPALVLAVPIKRSEGTIGVMAAAMTIDDISKRVANWRQGKTGFAFLVDEKGKVVAHQIDTFVQEQKSLSNHPLIEAHRNGRKGAVEFTSDDGQPTIGFAHETQYGWTLAVQQAKSEAFAAVDQAQKFALMLLLVTVLIVLVVAIMSSRTIVNPIKELTDAANRISVGDLDVEIQPKSKDEIGDLSEAIVRMQDSIRLSISRLRRRRRR